MRESTESLSFVRVNPERSSGSGSPSRTLRRRTRPAASDPTASSAEAAATRRSRAGWAFASTGRGSEVVPSALASATRTSARRGEAESSEPHRDGLELHVPFTRARIGDFDVDLFGEFFRGFVNHAKVTLHIDNLRGTNSHHQAETVFKAFGRALRMACTRDERMPGIMPSTKGTL